MSTLAQQIAKLSGYSDSFVRALTFVMQHEVEFQGGHYGDYDFVRTEHDPKDPGGTTKYGLDARSHMHVDIDSLNFGQAAGIYFRTIWTPLLADKLDPDVALVIADAAINCGTERAVRWLQASVGIEGDALDGNMGPHTLGNVNLHTDSSVCEANIKRRLYYYEEEVRPALREAYLKGWEARITDLHHIVVLGYGK